MPVVINTNSAAAIASNNLSASNAMLQKSLNRLSSGSRIVNASDDAGGVAVAQRLTAASKRAGVAAGNISSGLAFLQQQDAVFKTGAKIMERMNELQGLYRDTTKVAEPIGRIRRSESKAGDNVGRSIRANRLAYGPDGRSLRGRH